MTTREFINKVFRGETTVRNCASVFADSNGDLYSYGYHYPLLFTVGGKVIRNTRGYSSSTDRHIQWTRDINAIDIRTPGIFRLTGDASEIMLKLVQGQSSYIRDIQDKMASKKRKNTAIYRMLGLELSQAESNFRELTN